MNKLTIVFFLGIVFSFHFVEAGIQAIIFDCDGILVDTKGVKFQAWKKVLHSRGLSLSPKLYQGVTGMPGLSILHHLEKNFQIQLDPKIIEEKNETYKQLQKEGVIAFPFLISGQSNKI